MRQQCEINYIVASHPPCKLQAEWVNISDGSTLCRLHRNKYFTLDEVKPLEQMPRSRPLFDNPMTITLAVPQESEDLRPVLKELVDAVIDDLFDLTYRVMDAVAAAQRALGSVQ